MCMGMMGMGMYPDETGVTISALTAGDEILINYKDENGRDRQKVAIVWKIDGFSGLTTNGEPISCGMGLTIIPTGNHFKNYSVSRDAREFVEKMEERRGLTNFDPEPE